MVSQGEWCELELKEVLEVERDSAATPHLMRLPKVPGRSTWMRPT